VCKRTCTRVALGGLVFHLSLFASNTETLNLYLFKNKNMLPIMIFFQSDAYYNVLFNDAILYPRILIRHWVDKYNKH